MSEPAWNHQYLDTNDIEIHYARHGDGFPIVLLHGWPEFWLVWRKNILPLAESFDVVAPDLRGFGDTGKSPACPIPRAPSWILWWRTCAGSPMLWGSRGQAS